jgi:hypothetical protein
MVVMEEMASIRLLRSGLLARVSPVHCMWEDPWNRGSTLSGDRLDGLHNGRHGIRC